MSYSQFFSRRIPRQKISRYNESWFLFYFLFLFSINIKFLYIFLSSCYILFWNMSFLFSITTLQKVFQYDVISAIFSNVEPPFKKINKKNFNVTSNRKEIFRGWFLHTNSVLYLRHGDLKKTNQKKMKYMAYVFTYEKTMKLRHTACCSIAGLLYSLNL